LIAGNKFQFNAIDARHSLKPFSGLAIIGVLAHKTIFVMGNAV